ncbi:hypothetical protein SteCoe_17457 [Stentor coeruleus]|uniref:Translin-associated factor X-interacting protein 1 N-terminal domain-containing protein n=1 Tax=Stentor coeruleus TaxID=5963 RepID=A0A1R2BYW1_9CILI|nr:hypothetical protein SteCoe_17457 [Stentor coeruleus]
MRVIPNTNKNFTPLRILKKPTSSFKTLPIPKYCTTENPKPRNDSISKISLYTTSPYAQTNIKPLNLEKLLNFNRTGIKALSIIEKPTKKLRIKYKSYSTAENPIKIYSQGVSMLKPSKMIENIKKAKDDHSKFLACRAAFIQISESNCEYSNILQVIRKEYEKVLSHQKFELKQKTIKEDILEDIKTSILSHVKKLIKLNQKILYSVENLHRKHRKLHKRFMKLTKIDKENEEEKTQAWNWIVYENLMYDKDIDGFKEQMDEYKNKARILKDSLRSFKSRIGIENKDYNYGLSEEFLESLEWDSISSYNDSDDKELSSSEEVGDNDVDKEYIIE